MAFIKEGLNAFLGQPIEKKRSDHRLKSVDSNSDPRAWALDNELRRQHFLNVVKLAGDGGTGNGGEVTEDAKCKIPIKFRMVKDSKTKIYNELFRDKMQKLEGDNLFWKNIVADKENEIEQLLHHIRDIAEDLQSLLESQGNGTEQQKKSLKRRTSTHRDSMPNELERLQDHVEKMKEKLSEANSTIADLQRDNGSVATSGNKE